MIWFLFDLIFVDTSLSVTILAHKGSVSGAEIQTCMQGWIEFSIRWCNLSDMFLNCDFGIHSWENRSGHFPSSGKFWGRLCVRMYTSKPLLKHQHVVPSLSTTKVGFFQKPNDRVAASYQTRLQSQDESSRVLVLSRQQIHVAKRVLRKSLICRFCHGCWHCHWRMHGHWRDNVPERHPQQRKTNQELPNKPYVLTHQQMQLPQILLFKSTPSHTKLLRK